MNEDIMKNERIPDDALESVTGGNGDSNGTHKKMYNCRYCKKKTWFTIYSGGRAICDECGHEEMK